MNVTTLLQATHDSCGFPLVYPANGTPEVTAYLVEMEPGETTGWHQHPVPLMGYIISGQLTVELATGQKRTMRQGQVSIEVVDQVHSGINDGTETLKVIVFAIGLQNVPITIQVPHLPS